MSNITIISSMKRCTKCGTHKPFCEFSKSQKHKHGVHSICKICKWEASETWRAENRDRKNKRGRERLAAIRAQEPKKPRKKRSDANPNREEIRKKRLREWVLKNKDAHRQLCRQWRAKYPEKIREAKRKHRTKHQPTLMEILKKRMSSAINKSLRDGSKAGRGWQSLVDYTAEQLRVHIEKQFLPGMTWENRDKWHIDHKIPVSAFNFSNTSDIDFKRCWALKNLQPLWKEDNLSKWNRLDKPFQPSLLLMVEKH